MTRSSNCSTLYPIEFCTKYVGKKDTTEVHLIEVHCPRSYYMIHQPIACFIVCFISWTSCNILQVHLDWNFISFIQIYTMSTSSMFSSTNLVAINLSLLLPVSSQELAWRIIVLFYQFSIVHIDQIAYRIYPKDRSRCFCWKDSHLHISWTSSLIVTYFSIILECFYSNSNQT